LIVVGSALEKVRRRGHIGIMEKTVALTVVPLSCIRSRIRPCGHEAQMIQTPTFAAKVVAATFYRIDWEQVAIAGIYRGAY
jgi:hypothetical protein